MDRNLYKECMKRAQYMTTMMPIFNRRAVFADMTENYCSNSGPMPGETVRLRFRTAHNNVDGINVLTQNERIPMQFSFQRNDYDYYEVYIQIGSQPVHYMYEILYGDIVYYYHKGGLSNRRDDQYSFGLYPGFSTPNWAKGAVMYQILVDRFFDGDPDNDVEDREYIYIGSGVSRNRDWNKYPDALDVGTFYGGDLQGVMDKLDYLQYLGVDVIYFNPLFVSPSNHKYDIQDYDYIDPHIGKIVADGGECLDTWVNSNKEATKYIQRVTDKRNLEASNQLFIKLVEELHKRGMRVILDGVFNHCGSFNKWMDRELIYEDQKGYEKGAYVDKDSPYHDYFRFFSQQWPYNQSYDGWWGHDTLPKLNYEGSRALYDTVLEIGRKWVSPPFNADGWRLDVAADLAHSPEANHQFWKDFRRVVKEANPNALILAEHYGNPSQWLRGDEWDTVMNYDAFMEPVTWYLTGMQKHSDQYREDLKNNVASFRSTMLANMNNLPVNSLQTAMNQLSNHDHSRFLTRTNGKVGRASTLGPEAANTGVRKSVLREAVVIQMTWPGAPTIYYGDEAGLCGFTDPDCRRGYPWGHEDFDLIEFHRYMIQIHKEFKCISTGSLYMMDASCAHVLAYCRFDLDEQVVVLVNNTDNPCHVQVNVRPSGCPRDCTFVRVMETNVKNYSVGRLNVPVENGILDLDMKPMNAVVLSHREEKKKSVKKPAQEPEEGKDGRHEFQQ